MSIESLGWYFGAIEDPRCPGKIEHRLIEVRVIAVCAVIACAESWVVSAWASEQGLVLGQRRVDGKSNEITAVPELLDQLALENSIVTLDAMGARLRLPRRSWHEGATTC